MRNCAAKMATFSTMRKSVALRCGCPKPERELDDAWGTSLADRGLCTVKPLNICSSDPPDWNLGSHYSTACYSLCPLKVAVLIIVIFVVHMQVCENESSTTCVGTSPQKCQVIFMTEFIKYCTSCGDFPGPGHRLQMQLQRMHQLCP